jgi:hypothetical protein
MRPMTVTEAANVPWWRKFKPAGAVETLRMPNEGKQLLLTVLNASRRRAVIVRDGRLQSAPQLGVYDLLEPCECLRYLTDIGDGSSSFCHSHRLFGEVTKGIVWASIEP